MSFRSGRACPRLILLTATVISAVNVLVVLGLVHPASVHLAVVNVALASVLAVAARGLVPSEPPTANPADGPTHHREGDFT